MSAARSLSSLFALDKLFRCLSIISGNGGLFRSARKLWRNDTLKTSRFQQDVVSLVASVISDKRRPRTQADGRLVGSDAFGNKYYENNYYMLGRSRWVEYNDAVKWDYDASQVNPEWHGWLHYKTDRIPSEDCAKLCLGCCSWCDSWLQPHSENMTNTSLAYVPYTTTREKIQLWDGSNVIKL